MKIDRSGNNLELKTHFLSLPQTWRKAKKIIEIKRSQDIQQEEKETIGMEAIICLKKITQSKYHITNIKYHQSIKYQQRRIIYQVLKSNINYQIIDIKYKTSNLLYQKSIIQYRILSTRYQV